MEDWKEEYIRKLVEKIHKDPPDKIYYLQRVKNERGEEEESVLSDEEVGWATEASWVREGCLAYLKTCNKLTKKEYIQWLGTPEHYKKLQAIDREKMWARLEREQRTS